MLHLINKCGYWDFGTQKTFQGSIRIVVLGNTIAANIDVDASNVNFFLDAATQEITRFFTGMHRETRLSVQIMQNIGTVMLVLQLPSAKPVTARPEMNTERLRMYSFCPCSSRCMYKGLL